MKQENISYRYAQEHELEIVAKLIMKRAEEFDFTSSGFPEPEYDVVLDTVKHNWNLAPCIVAVKDSEIIGLASLTLSAFGWSKKLYLSPFMVYVLPQHRNFGIIKRIYQKIQEFADLHGILYADDYVAIDRVDARRRLMRGLGFKESGFLLTYQGVKR